ncbi:MAG: PH domain-containing protein [Sphingomonas sp.]|uniref:PH domain-containing protein n=1 Tax=Sphingomonas sp. TaxID=28214 RepID=UPI001B13A007|nr:PH domain-containing protein [Sphingomonas sp.]MBO9622404.1 PH domain-containing protein [Sphingomonas sp.]
MQGIRFAPQDVFAIPFAAFWLFVVLAIFGAVTLGQPEEVQPMFWFVLPVFLLVGLHMLFGRFLVDRAARRRTHYWLTTERAVIESGLFRTSSRSVSLAALSEIRFRAGRNRRGTVQFGSAGPFGMVPPSWPGADQFLSPAFNDIDDAQRVYDLTLATQRGIQSKA